MGAAVAWVSAGLAVLGLVVVVGAVMSLTGRLRPLRRALRRLSWRQETLVHLRARAMQVQQRVEVLTAEASDLAQRRSRRPDAPG